MPKKEKKEDQIKKFFDILEEANTKGQTIRLQNAFSGRTAMIDCSDLPILLREIKGEHA